MWRPRVRHRCLRAVKLRAQRNSSNTMAGVDSTGHAAVAQINQLPASSSDRQGVVRLGVRHKF